MALKRFSSWQLRAGAGPALPSALMLVCALAVGIPRADADTPSHALPPGAAPDVGPSPVIFPPARIPIHMTHDRHVVELGLKCVDCHDRAATSQSSADILLPSGKRCDSCHGTDHRDLGKVQGTPDEPLARCELCHEGHEPAAGNAVAPVHLPRPNLRFDHAAHHRRNIGCGQCHGSVRLVSQATRDQLPRMRGCLRCHAMPGPSRGAARGECNTCHLTSRGTLETHFSSGKLVPPAWLGGADHGPSWVERHKIVAGADSQLCASCHTEDECADCHDGRVRPRRIHPNDWLSQHGVATRMASQRCTSCHRQQSFCVECHARVGLAQSGPLTALQSRGRFHPPPSVWTEGPRRRGHHAWEARRNLSACVGCHVERDCVACHATAARGGPASPNGGFGPRTNPHPSDFRIRCRSAYRRNPRPCMVCHEPGDRNLRSCR